METKDYFIKDEGDYFTLGLISDKAKTLFLNELVQDLEITMRDDNGVLKTDLLTKIKSSIIAWLVSHNLRGEEI